MGTRDGGLELTDYVMTRGIKSRNFTSLFALKVCEPVLAMAFAKPLPALERVSIAMIFAEMSMSMSCGRDVDAL